MKQRVKTLLCLLLCAMMIIPGALFVGAEDHVYDSAEEAHTHEASEAEPQPDAQADITSGTEEDIENLSCEAKGAPNGKHVLATSFDIVASEDGTRLVRGEADIRVFGQSCTTNGGGASRRACKYCSKWFTVIVPGEKAEGHKFDKTEELTSKCDSVKYQVSTCSVCGFVEVKVNGADASIELSKHKAGAPETIAKKNCSTDSVTITKCTECSLVLSCVDNGPRGHSGNWLTTKNSSCSEDGVSTFECGRCGYSTTRPIPKTSHIKGTRYIVEPTCDKGGIKHDVCIYCDLELSKEEEVPALGHQWIDKEPSLCDQKPYHVCARCGKSEDLESGEPVGHTWSENETVAPTCAKEGYTFRRCTKCGLMELVGTPVPPTGKHEWTAREDTVAATCGTTGEYREKCAVCGELGTVHQTPPVGEHTPEDDDGDCTTPVHCKVCSLVVTAASESHNFKYSQVPAPQHLTEYSHRKTCQNPNCKVTETEKCSGEDDADCTTPVICTLCKREIKSGSIHIKSGTFKECPDEEDLYHIELCKHAGCNGTVGEKMPHTYVDGKCTVCDHVDGRVHVPDGEWKSDGNFHWQTCKLCGGKTMVSSHDKTDTGPYDGDCTKAVNCTVCGHEVKAASTHSYSGQWEFDSEFHYRICTNPGCTSREQITHTAKSDGDCTTPDVCPDCGYEVVKGGASHSWTVAKDGHTDTHHKLVCSNDGCTKTSEAPHKAGIAATCKDRAECADCHTEFGSVNPENHVGATVIKGQKPATEEEEGYTGDTYCSSCNALLSTGEKIDKLPSSHKHDYSILAKDGEYHWYECSCGAIKEDSVAVHDYGPWKYTDEATHSRECKACGYTDSERHEHGADPHDCTKSIDCVDCGAVVVPAAAKEHNFSGRAVGTAEGHTVACTNAGCEQTTAVISHSGGVSSCESGGHCEICDYEYLLRNPNVHTGGTEIRNHKDPTTTEKGYTGDTYCLGCGALLEAGTDIDVLPEEHTHSFGEWITDAAHHWKTCSCGAVESYGEHSFYKGICAVCGAVDPSYKEPPKMLVDSVNSVVGTYSEDNADYYADIELVVDRLDAEDTDYTSAKNTVGNMYKDFVPFDISLFNLTEGKEVQPKGTLTISIPVPAGWKAEKTLVFHVDGTKTEKIKATVSADGAYVTFTVDHLSVYVLANAETEIGAVPPQTGDMNVFVGLGTALVLAAVGTAATVRTKKRYHR